ncbi:hypothetical protein GJAV_G00129650 [Gymnothorax javanicus]|nr:hypothetical protein GJAV_G00129650 [Gymnothorax javanicus]
MMPRLPAFLPFVAPMLAVIGWWWFFRKRKEFGTPKKEGKAVTEVLNGMVESSQAGLTVKEGNTVALVEDNHTLPTSAMILSQSLAQERIDSMDTPSETCLSRLPVSLDDVALESLLPNISEGQSTPHLPNTSSSGAEESELKTSTLQCPHDDEQVIDISESGHRGELAADQSEVTEEEGTLAPHPSCPPAEASDRAPAKLTEAAGTKMEMDRPVETEYVAVPSHDHLYALPVQKDQTLRSTRPDAPCPEASCHIPTMQVPLSNREPEGSLQQDSHGGFLERAVVLDPAEVSCERLSMAATREDPIFMPRDLSEEGDGRLSQVGCGFPLSDEPLPAVIAQNMQDDKVSMEVLCCTEEDWVGGKTEQTSNVIPPVVLDGSSISTSAESPKDEELLNASSAHSYSEEVEDNSSCGTEAGQKKLCSEDSFPSLCGPQMEDVSGKGDSECGTGQSKDPRSCQSMSIREELAREPLGQSTSCALAAETETQCSAPDQAEPDDRLSSNGMQQGPFSPTPQEATVDEGSQNTLISSPLPEQVINDATSPTVLQKNLPPEAAPLSQDEPQKDDVTGMWDSEIRTCQPGDGAGRLDHIPSTGSGGDSNEILISDASPDLGMPSSSAERESGDSIEEGDPGTLCRGEVEKDVKLQEGSPQADEMEEGNTREISSVISLEEPVVIRSECVDEEKPSNPNTSCILDAHNTESPSSTTGQVPQENDQTSCETPEGSFSALTSAASGNDTAQNGPVRQEPDDDAGGTTETVQKSPGPETELLTAEEAQTLENVAAEDSGCSTSQSEDGACSQGAAPSTERSCTESEQDEDLMGAPEVSGALEVCSNGPEGAPRCSLQEGHQETLFKPERLSDGSFQNGGVEVSRTETHLWTGGGSDVNCQVKSGLERGRGEDPGYSGRPAHPKNPEPSVWEIQVPKLLVGRLIGKRGRYMSFLKQKSGAKIHVSPRVHAQAFQICHIEGTKQQVERALGLIRKKFESLDLSNVCTPPPPPERPSSPVTSWLRLPEDAPVEVTVVKIVSVNRMFVQQPKHPSYPALRELDQDMRVCYSKPAPGLPSPTEAGVLCAAPGVDGAWRRAQVISFDRETDEAEIRYVDYGGYYRARTSSLLQIRPDFLTLPFQGAEVVLSNVKPLPGDDFGGFSVEARAALEEMTRGASLLAQVTSYSDCSTPFIQMWMEVEEELVMVNRMLVDRGLAVWQ